MAFGYGTGRNLTDREKIATEWQMIGAAAQVLQVPNPPKDLGNGQEWNSLHKLALRQSVLCFQRSDEVPVCQEWNSLHKLALRQIAESIVQIDKLKSEQKS